MARPPRGTNRSAKPRPLRRSQLISPFGVGAISDFRDDEALMCAGLEEWFGTDSDIPPHLRLEEARLQRRLGKTFFVRPPEHLGQDQKRRSIPFVRFPQWHYCPRCFRMHKATLFQDQPSCNPCKDGRRRRMIPVRIVAVCEYGHIEDFPFRRWIRCTCSDDDVARLFFKAGRSSAGLGGIHISCEACGRARSLAGAMNPQMLAAVDGSCNGGRPWFAEEHSHCGRPMQGAQRGSSNVYFPVVINSIYVPDEQGGNDDRILALLEDPQLWDMLTSALEDDKIDRARCKLVAHLKNVDEDRLWELAQAKLTGTAASQTDPATEEEFRRQEYRLLCSSLTTAELVSDWIDGAHYGPLGEFINGVGLVRKLRETRVLCGFSRLSPGSDLMDPIVQPLARTAALRWLPGIDVYGEGIFIDFRRELLEKWSRQREVRQRIEPVLSRFEQIRRSRGQEPLGVHSRMVFLHSFAHAFIKELVFSCGYGSSALRERLYVDMQQPEAPMSGVLIYTASGDADGTLGGLVAQASPGRLPRLVTDALRRATWCSNDPVCMESAGRPADAGNLAACHSCSLIPETSCEHGNRLLDRATLVGTVVRPKLGFLSALVPGQMCAATDAELVG
jgi:hypothetical protein